LLTNKLEPKETMINDDDDVYFDRITQQKLKNYPPYVKYRPARKGIYIRKELTKRPSCIKSETKKT
jgi:hypothetical protein